MSYTIKSRREQITVITEVEYNINGTIVTVDVSHFMPSNEAEIILGIENREVSETNNLIVE